MLHVLTLNWLIEQTLLPCIHCNNIDLCVPSTRLVLRMLQISFYMGTRLKSVLGHSSPCMRVAAEDTECCTQYIQELTSCSPLPQDHYLHYSSSHPRSVFRGLVKGEAISFSRSNHIEKYADICPHATPTCRA